MAAEVNREGLHLACPVCKQMIAIPADLDGVEFVNALNEGDAASGRGLVLLLDRLAAECQYAETMRHEGRPS